MHDPAVQDIFNRMADVSDMIGPVLRNPYLDEETLEIMIGNIEKLLTQLYKMQSVLIVQKSL
jgi:hypothetical protein